MGVGFQASANGSLQSVVSGWGISFTLLSSNDEWEVLMSMGSAFPVRFLVCTLMCYVEVRVNADRLPGPVSTLCFSTGSHWQVPAVCLSLLPSGIGLWACVAGLDVTRVLEI